MTNIIEFDPEKLDPDELKRFNGGVGHIEPFHDEMELDAEAAKIFKTAPPQEQKKMEALLSLWLKEIAAAETRSLKEVMDETGRKAEERGMTPEILKSILDEE